MKKLCSVLLTAALLLSVFAAGAVNVSAAEDSFPLLSIYANPEIFGNVQQMTAYIYEKDGGALFEWGSEQCNMRYDGGEYWSYDMDAHGIAYDASKTYYVIFTDSWKNDTNELELPLSLYFATAYPTGKSTTAPSDGKRTFEVVWEGYSPEPDKEVFLYADPAVFGDYSAAYACIYDDSGNPVFPWGSNSCKMENLDDGNWCYNLTGHGVTLRSDTTYYISFSFDWKQRTDSLELTDHLFDTACFTGKVTGEGGATVYEINWQTAADSDELPAPKWYRRDDGKIYYYANPEVKSNFNKVYAFIITGSEDFRSERYAMTNEGDGVWSYDLAAHGFDVSKAADWQVMFSYDWETYPLTVELTANQLGDIAYVSQWSDSDGMSYYVVKWADSKAAPPPVRPVIPGDVDGDGVLTVGDCTLLQQYLAEFTVNGMPVIDSSDERMFATADFNGDGTLNVMDVTAMQRALAEFAAI